MITQRMDPIHKRGICLGLVAEWIAARGDIDNFGTQARTPQGVGRIGGVMNLMNHKNNNTELAITKNYVRAYVKARGVLFTMREKSGRGERCAKIPAFVQDFPGLYYCGLQGNESGHAIGLKHIQNGGTHTYAIFDPNYFYYETDEAADFTDMLSRVLKANYPHLKTWFIDSYSQFY